MNWIEEINIEQHKRITRLARLVLLARHIEAKEMGKKCIKEPPYYLMFMGHPAVKGLYERWRAKYPVQYAVGDLDRTVFELSMLNEDALQGLEETLANVEKEN